MLETKALPLVVRLTALPVGLSLALTGCLGGGESGDREGGGGGRSGAGLAKRDAVIAREGIFGGGDIANATGRRFRMEIVSLERSGRFTRLRVAANYLDEGGRGHSLTFAGFYLLDAVGRKAYPSMGHHELSAAELWFTKGVRYESTIWFPQLPPDVKQVTVLTPGSAGEMPGVTVSDGPAAPPPGAPKPGPTVTGTAEPQPGQTVVYDADQPAGTAPRVVDIYDQIEGAAGTSISGGGTQTEDLRSDVLFAFDSDRLSGKAAGILDKIAQDVAQRADTTRPVTIEGHTDGKGDSSYNQSLSERRARAVQAAIVPRLGSARLQVAGKGADEPVAKETTDSGADSPSGRARNRRVEITYSLKNAAPAAGSASAAAPGGRGGPGRPAPFRAAPGGVVAERNGTAHNSTGEPLPFRLRVHPFYRDGAFLVAVVEMTSLAPAGSAAQPAGIGGEGWLGGHVNAFTVTDAAGTTYRAARYGPAQNDGDELYVGSDNMYWEAQKPYRSYLYLTAPPAGTKSVTLNAGPFGKFPDVPVVERP